MSLIPTLGRNISEFRARWVYTVSSMRLCFKSIKTKNNQTKPGKFKLSVPTKSNLLAFESILFEFLPTPGRREKFRGERGHRSL